MTSVLAEIRNYDFSDIYASLVWIAAALGVGWTGTIWTDPANLHCAKWTLHMRRLGMLVSVAGLLVSVLFGGSMGWVPWPPMVIVVAGLNFYLAGSILCAQARIKSACAR